MHFLKKGQKIRAWVDPPPHSGNARKKTFFFIDVFPKLQTTYSAAYNNAMGYGMEEAFQRQEDKVLETKSLEV